MANVGSMNVSQIAVYPIKGFPALPLTTTQVSTGKILPLDRRFALTLDPSAADARGWKNKRYLLQIFNTAILSGFKCEIELFGDGIKISFPDKGDTFELPEDADAFLDLVGLELDSKFGLSDGQTHYAFADQKRPLISLLNMASLEDMARRSGQPLDWRRMRGNIVIDGLEAWEEAAFVGKKLKIGKAEFEVVELIQRCAAPGVNLQGVRDMDLLKFMMKSYKHTDCGLFLKALNDAEIKQGSVVKIL